MADEWKLPIKVVLSRQEDYHAPDTGGGPKKVFGDVTDEVRERLADSFDAVGAHFASSFASEPQVPAVARVVLKEDAFAKSHRPEIFNRSTCPIIGAQRFGELLVSVTPKGVKALVECARHDSTKAGIAGLSTIERFEPFTATDALDPTLTGTLREDNANLKLRLFRHGFDTADESIAQALGRRLKGWRVAAERLGQYGPRLRIFSISGLKPEQLEELAKFVGVQSLGAFPMYRVVRTASTIVRPMMDDDFPSPDPERDYPVVGLIDTGTNPDDPRLAPWIVKRHDYVPPDLENFEHGSFVAGLLVRAQDLNHHDKRFPEHSAKIVDVAAVPDGGHVSERDLLTILAEVLPEHPEVRVWNMSLATAEPCATGVFSEFGIALDDLQEKHNAMFVIAAGNYVTPPHRGWPSDVDDGSDSLCTPADSLRGLTVGSLAHLDNAATRVRSGEPSPFSRRGPGPMFVPKPEVSHYGGNCDEKSNYAQTGVLSLDGKGNLAENIGTSFAAPLVTTLAGHVHHVLDTEPSINLIKAFIVHSAVLESTGINAHELRYRGFGVPRSLAGTLGCDPWCATLIFEPELTSPLLFGKEQFPMPDCLHDAKGRLRGEIAMTLVYDPPLDPAYGSEYCRTNVDASLGTFAPDKNGVFHHTGQVPAEPRDVNLMYEKNLVEQGFKWSPVKVYRRRIPNGMTRQEWRLRLSVHHRHGFATDQAQRVALIVSIFDPKRIQPVYNDVVTAMARNGWITEDLQLRAGSRVRP